jgi:membrane protein involved in colicin uptake
MIKLVHDVETNEVAEVPLTEEEIVDFEARKAEAEAKALADAQAAEQARLEAEAKAANKAAALGRLGLTEEEINAFLS